MYDLARAPGPKRPARCAERSGNSRHAEEKGTTWSGGVRTTPIPRISAQVTAKSHCPLQHHSAPQDSKPTGSEAVLPHLSRESWSQEQDGVKTTRPRRVSVSRAGPRPRARRPTPSATLDVRPLLAPCPRRFVGQRVMKKRKCTMQRVIFCMLGLSGLDSWLQGATLGAETAKRGKTPWSTGNRPLANT